MKKSKNVRLVLIGGLAVTALPGCTQPAPVTTQDVYTNNFYIPGAGYYHAPFRAWFVLPYNHYDAGTQRYFYGGQWGGAPFESITNISPPTLAAASAVEARRTDISRGGFGGTSGYHSGYWGVYS